MRFAAITLIVFGVLLVLTPLALLGIYAHIELSSGIPAGGLLPAMAQGLKPLVWVEFAAILAMGIALLVIATRLLSASRS